MPKIVLIGGGTGVAELLATFRQTRGAEVSAVVSVFDNGGSSGILRRRFGIPAVGDLRKVFSAALPPSFAKLLETRAAQHPLGNLFFARLAQEKGFPAACEIYRDLSGGAVHPVSFSNSQLVGELANGGEIRGEEKFDRLPKKFARQKIEKVSLRPHARLNPAVKKVLQAADKIVVGPGSFFGSLLVHFAVTGLPEIFRKASAEKILAVNATREFGCRGESAAEIAARFPVDFDRLLLPPKNSKKWNPRLLAKKVLA